MEIFFRNSMFGYNKHDVSEFILKQSKKLDSEVKERDLKITELEKELAEINKSLTENNQKLEDLQSFENNFDEIVVQIKTALDELKESAKNSLSECESEIEQAKKIDSDIISLNERIAKSKEFIDKAKKFDALAGMINGMVGKNESEDNDYEIPNDDRYNEVSYKLSDIVSQNYNIINKLNDKINSIYEIIEKLGR